MQQELETVLSELSILTQKHTKNTFLVDFKGQLELNEADNRIFWNLCLQTKSKTTKRQVIYALGKILYGKDYDAKANKFIQILKDLERMENYHFDPRKQVNYQLDPKNLVHLKQTEYIPERSAKEFRILIKSVY